jgi:prepilin-type N-terminal cleavage/methylation domain-containing protein/prepilin-type processing-associated H-X9-DG protein
MNRSRRAFTLIELLVVIAIIAILAAILFPVFAQARSKARQASGLSNAKQVALGILMYVQDYDEVFPRAGWECQTNADAPDIPVGTPNPCGGTNWQNVVYPYTKNAGIYTSPGDSSTPNFNWGPNDDFKFNDGKFSLLINDLLSHSMPTTAAGYADPNNQAHAASGLSLAAVNAPADAILIMEGHCGWNKDKSPLAPAEATLFDGRNANTTPAVKQSKFFKEQTMSGYQVQLVAGTTMGGWRVINGAPFYNGGGNVAFTDGHAKWYKFTDGNGNPTAICQTLPWTRHVDPQQRNAQLNSCNDPANPLTGTLGNWH